MFTNTAFLLLAVRTICGSADVSKHIIQLDGVSYEADVLIEGLHTPFNLRVDKKRDTLYLNYRIEISDWSYYQLGILNLKDKNLTKLGEPQHEWCAAIQKDKVFLGGWDGIYKYDYVTNKYSPTNITKSIWSLTATDNILYFITLSDFKLHKYVDDNTEILVDKFSQIQILQYAVGKGDTIYYSNETGLYTIDGKTNDELVISNDLYVRAIAINKNGNAYFAANGTIFKEEDKKLQQAGGIGVLSIAFDRDDNLIFSTKNAVYRVQTGSTE